MPIDPEFWARILNDILADIMAWLPALAGALALLVLGWIIARLVQAFLGSLLRRLGLDRLAERAGASRLLARSGLDPSAAHLVARLVYWLVLLLFVLAAAERLGLRGVVAETLGRLVAYLPNVLVAILILLLGGVVARVVGDTVSALTTQSGVSSGPLLGQAVRYVLLIFVAILALEQLGVQTTLLIALAIALILATALALALAFGLGSRELARNIMAGFYAREEFAIQQRLRVRGHTGRLLSIGPIKSVIETESGRVLLPNFTLTDEEVTLVPDTTEEVTLMPGPEEE